MSTTRLSGSGVLENITLQGNCILSGWNVYKNVHVQGDTIIDHPPDTRLSLDKFETENLTIEFQQTQGTVTFSGDDVIVKQHLHVLLQPNVFFVAPFIQTSGRIHVTGDLTKMDLSQIVTEKCAKR